MVNPSIVILFFFIFCPFSAFATTMFCEDLNANSLAAIESITETKNYLDSINESETLEALDKDLAAAISNRSDELSVTERSRLLVAASQLGLLRTVKVILNHDVEIDWREQNQEISATALFLSAWCEKTDIVDLLLSAGASMKTESCLPFAGSLAVECTYPLHAAVAGNNFDGGDPQAICVMFRGSAHFRDAKELIDTIGLNVQEYLKMVSQTKKREDISRALNGECQENMKPHRPRTCRPVPVKHAAPAAGPSTMSN